MHFSVRYGAHNARTIVCCTVHSFRGPEPYLKLSVIQSILGQSRMTQRQSKIIPNSNLVKGFSLGFLIFTISQFYCTFASHNEDDGMCSFSTPFRDLADNYHTYGHGMDFSEAGNVLSSYFTTEGKHPLFK